MLTRINKHRDEAGFTLIELLVVVIIIGILPIHPGIIVWLSIVFIQQTRTSCMHNRKNFLHHFFVCFQYGQLT